MRYDFLRTMPLRARHSLPLAAAILLAAAGCGGGGGGGNKSSKPAGSGTPTAGSLVRDTLTASKPQHSAHYALDVSLKVATNGAAANPQLQALTGQPFTLHIEGDAGNGKVTADGNVSAAGRTFTGKLLAGKSELYVNLLGSWYGSKTTGLGTLKKTGLSAASKSAQLPTSKTNLQTLEQQANQLLSGTISSGPTTDGTATWQFSGTLNPAGIESLAAKSGSALPSSTKQELDALAKAAKLLILTGKSDNLLREFKLSLSLSQADLSKLSAGAGASGSATFKSLKSLDVSIDLKLSKWGEAVSYTAPAQFQPLSGLLSGLVKPAG